MADKNSSQLGLLGIFSFLSILLLQQSQSLESVRIVLQIMLNMSSALSGGKFLVATLVGFITLTGITSRNGIMIISHYIHLFKQAGKSFPEQMICSGELEQIVPWQDDRFSGLSR